MCNTKNCNCNCKSKFSNYSIFGVCTDQACRDAKIADDCRTAHPTDSEEDIKACVDGTKVLQAADPNNTTDPLSWIGNALTKLETATQAQPTITSVPPASNKLILGLQPSFAIPAGIALAALLTWGIYELTKSKTAKA